METSSAAQRLAARFVAGETLDQALDAGRKLNSEGIHVTFDCLGESVASLAEAAEARDVYLRTLAAIRQTGIRGHVSLKLTQFGLDFSREQCRANVEQLVRQAEEAGSFVRVDMESSAYTTRTLDLVRDIHTRHKAVGVVIQACLRRSLRDIEDLCRRGIRVRLCKGAYLESATAAFPRKADVDRSFADLMELLLDRGAYPAIATHDEALTEETRRYAAFRKIPPDAYEFQMLYGIRGELQRKLVRDGYRLRLYVPFGKAWYPYYMRRLAERPANVVFVARNLLRK